MFACACERPLSFICLAVRLVSASSRLVEGRRSPAHVEITPFARAHTRTPLDVEITPFVRAHTRPPECRDLPCRPPPEHGALKKLLLSSSTTLSPLDCSHCRHCARPRRRPRPPPPPPNGRRREGGGVVRSPVAVSWTERSGDAALRPPAHVVGQNETDRRTGRRARVARVAAARLGPPPAPRARFARAVPHSASADRAHVCICY